MREHPLQIESVGYWSEVKLEIIRKYAKAYSTVLSAQTHPRLRHVYIDGFAGAGEHLSRKDGSVVSGSPLIALEVAPPFCEYYFVDLDPTKTQHLGKLIGERADVCICTGDCNQVLLNEVFPNADYHSFKRGLCILDPYGLHLDWNVVQTAGKMESIEIFLNFPVMDMNRNVFWKHPEGVRESDLDRMDRFWGDDSWKRVAYVTRATLFEDEKVKNDMDAVVAAYRKRLSDVAGFRFVPEPLPMRNSQGAIVYYLFFAAQKPVAKQIVESIFDTYRGRGLK